MVPLRGGWPSPWRVVTGQSESGKSVTPCVFILVWRRLWLVGADILMKWWVCPFSNLPSFCLRYVISQLLWPPTYYPHGGNLFRLLCIWGNPSEMLYYFRHAWHLELFCITRKCVEKFLNPSMEGGHFGMVCVPSECVCDLARPAPSQEGSMTSYYSLLCVLIMYAVLMEIIYYDLVSISDTHLIMPMCIIILKTVNAIISNIFLKPQAGGGTHTWQACKLSFCDIHLLSPCCDYSQPSWHIMGETGSLFLSLLLICVVLMTLFQWEGLIWPWKK